MLWGVYKNVMKYTIDSTKSKLAQRVTRVHALRHRGQAGGVEYLLEWRGVGTAEATWEPRAHCGVSWGVGAHHCGPALVYLATFRQVAARPPSHGTRPQAPRGEGVARRTRQAPWTSRATPLGWKRYGVA